MDGFLNLDKPRGLTSHDVVARLRRLLRGERIGHTGTLDPIATGVLPLCLGRATRVAQLVVETDKEYRVTLKLGSATDTQDATGRVLRQADPVQLARLDPAEARKVIERFQGPLTQLPPMYSAVKVGGRPLYKAARAGQEVERAPRCIMIHRISILALDLAAGRIVLDVTCSKGTYIRTLCADIGERLGVGGHMAELTRRRSGPFRIEAALPLAEAETLAGDGRLGERLMPIETVLEDHAGLAATTEGSRQIGHGRTLTRQWVARLPKEFKTGDRVLVYNPSGKLIALAQALADRQAAEQAAPEAALFKPERVLNAAD